MSLQWIEHEGQRMLLIDVANLRGDHATLAKELASLVTLLKAEPLKSVLAVADLRNTNLSNNVVMTLIRNAPAAAPYFRRSALVIEPNHARNIILDSLDLLIEQLPKRFEHLDDAKDWLVSQEIKQPA